MSYQYDFTKTSKKVIANLENLFDTLDITKSEFESALSLPHDQKYKSFIIPKSNGSDRIVYSPHKDIRRIQRRINRRIFNSKKNDCNGLISWPSYLYGSIPNIINDNSTIDHSIVTDLSKDYIACAKNHCGARSIMKMDINNFFDNIHQDQVFNIFNKLLKFPKDVSEALTSICCFKGSIVQGALTSSYIASAVMFDIEAMTVKRLHKKKLVYTRLVDDITVSSKEINYDYSFAKKVIIDMLTFLELPVNNSKTTLLYSSTSELLVHGLRVNYEEPRLPSTEVSRIRASVKNLEKLAEDGVYRISRDYRKSFNRCLGRVNKLGRLGHKQHSLLLERVNKIQPLPSKNDIKRALKFIEKIEGWYPAHQDDYWYRKCFNRAHSELNILQRTFCNTAKSLRTRLRFVSPPNEE